LLVAVACACVAVSAYRTWGGVLPAPLHRGFASPSMVQGELARAETVAEPERERGIRSSSADAFDSDLERSLEDRAAEASAAATRSRDAFLSTVRDPVAKKSARIFSDAAVAGARVKRIEAAVAATDETEACARFFRLARLDAEFATCEVSRAEEHEEAGASDAEALEAVEASDWERAKMAKPDVDGTFADATQSSGARVSGLESNSKTAKASVARREEDRGLEDMKRELERVEKLLAETGPRFEPEVYEDDDALARRFADPATRLGGFPAATRVAQAETSKAPKRDASVSDEDADSAWTFADGATALLGTENDRLGSREADATTADATTAAARVDFVVEAAFTPTDFASGVLDTAVSSLRSAGVPVVAEDVEPLAVLLKMDAALARYARRAAEAKAKAARSDPSPPPPFYPTEAFAATPRAPQTPDAPRLPPPRLLADEREEAVEVLKEAHAEPEDDENREYAVATAERDGVEDEYRVWWYERRGEDEGEESRKFRKSESGSAQSGTETSSGLETERAAVEKVLAANPSLGGAGVPAAGKSEDHVDHQYDTERSASKKHPRRSLGRFS